MSIPNTAPKVIISRRPLRERPIGKDDIINLKIALETATSWDDLLRMI